MLRPPTITYKRTRVGYVVAATAALGLIASNGSLKAQQTSAPPKCSFAYEAAHDVTDVIKREGFAFAGYDALCRRLEKEGVAVSIASSSGVLQGRAYGWVVVSLVRVKTKVYGAFTSRSTALSTVPDTPEERKMIMKAVNLSLEEIARDPSPFLTSVTNEEASLRRTLLAL